MSTVFQNQGSLMTIIPPSKNEMAGWYNVRSFFILKVLILKTPTTSSIHTRGPSVLYREPFFLGNRVWLQRGLSSSPVMLMHDCVEAGAKPFVDNLLMRQDDSSTSTSHQMWLTGFYILKNNIGTLCILLTVTRVQGATSHLLSDGCWLKPSFTTWGEGHGHVKLGKRHNESKTYFIEAIMVLRAGHLSRASLQLSMCCHFSHSSLAFSFISLQKAETQ